MILADTSIWIDHLRSGDPRLVDLLDGGQLLCHPFVTGEIALGSLRQRDLVVASLRDLPAATVATDDEVLDLIGRDRLFGQGIGYVDAHLLAAVRLTPGARLWTRDKRLRTAAEDIEIAVADW